MICKNNFRELCLDRFSGASCCVVGAGPSINQADIGMCYSMPCFIVNSAILALDWSTGLGEDRFWISNDTLCLRWSYWEKVKNSLCNIVVRESWEKHANIIPSRARFFSPRKSNTIIDESDDGLCYCSSVPTCLDMAIKFGFKKIYLFGVDHDIDNNGYFWSSWSEDKKPMQVVDYAGERKFLTKPLALVQPKDQRISVWNENIDCFQSISNYAALKDVKIMNMNKSSKIKSFEFHA
jgi:hypothetical protein